MVAAGEGRRSGSRWSRRAAPDRNGEEVVASKGEVENSWQALSLVVTLILHAEAKAAACLAGSGVVAGVLYSLVAELEDWSSGVALAAVVCAGASVLAGLAAGLVLVPRLLRRTPATSLLYFRHVASRWPRAAHFENFELALRSVLEDDRRLVGQIAQQIHANSLVARSKYNWCTLAVASLLAAMGGLGATALLLAR